MTYLEHCRYRNVDGVCVVCADFYAPEVIELVDSNLPVVTIDHSFNNRSCVLSDNIGGLKLLVDAACQKGHRKIAYVHGEKSSVTENRIIGFYRAMQEHGLNVNPDFVVEALYDNPATSMQAVLNLMDRPDPPTCILPAGRPLDPGRAAGSKTAELARAGGFVPGWIRRHPPDADASAAADHHRAGYQAHRRTGGGIPD